MRPSNRRILTVFLLLCATLTRAQEGKTGYQFLNIPVSAHSAALGGANISVVEDDASMMWTNAALLTGVSDHSILLGYNAYIRSSHLMSAGYVKTIGERGAWALGAQALTYGSMDETDEAGRVVGSFSAKDLNFQTSYSYMLTDYWSGAVTAKALMSNYANYNSVALGADLAVHYYDPSHGFAMGVTARNLGGQVKTLYDDGAREAMPFNLAIGISHDLPNAPLRISLTGDDLTHWDHVNFIQHLVLGIDILPSQHTWVALGYNFRRAHEMQVADKSKWAGVSIGAGLNVRKLKMGIAYGKYHVAASSLLINAAFSLR